MGEAQALKNTALKEPDSPKRIGVLSFHVSKETKAILNAIRALGHEPVWLREENTRTWIDSGELSFDPDVNVVVNRLLVTKSNQPVEDLGVAMGYASVRPILNPPDRVLRAMHKYATATALAEAGLDVPDAYMAYDRKMIEKSVDFLAGKTVHKPAIGTNGKHMSLRTKHSRTSPTIPNRRDFLQEYIGAENEDVHDVRVYVVDGEIPAAMKRYAADGEWRTNVSQGGQVVDMTEDLPECAAELAKDATQVIGLDYAGVDLLFHEGKWFVLEVNATAGFTGLYRATGVSPAAHIARMAIEQVDGGFSDDQFDIQMSVFDHSTPSDCGLNQAVQQSSGRTIGFTERVEVGGNRDVHRAIGKVDTGAKRTSIDMEIAARVGAGPIVDTTRIKSGSQNATKSRALVEVEINVADQWHTVTASLEDRSHMTYPVLLGRDILEAYVVDISRRVEEE